MTITILCHNCQGKTAINPEEKDPFKNHIIQGKNGPMFVCSSCFKLWAEEVDQQAQANRNMLRLLPNWCEKCGNLPPRCIGPGGRFLCMECGARLAKAIGKDLILSELNTPHH